MLARVAYRFVFIVSLTLAACGINSAPILSPIADRVAAVADELSISLHATDSDGDSLRFSYDAPDLPNLAQRMPPPTLDSVDDNDAVFRFIPQASDASDVPYSFEFHVSDGKVTTTAEVSVTIRDGLSGGPAFVKPLGSGTTLDLSMMACLALDIEVNDTTATSVTIAEEPPLIDGATLTTTDAFTATWMWCPTQAQLAAQDRYYLHLSADDGRNPKTTLPPFLIVVLDSTM